MHEREIREMVKRAAAAKDSPSKGKSQCTRRVTRQDWIRSKDKNHEVTSWSEIYTRLVLTGRVERSTIVPKTQIRRAEKQICRGLRPQL